MNHENPAMQPVPFNRKTLSPRWFRRLHGKRGVPEFVQRLIKLEEEGHFTIARLMRWRRRADQTRPKPKQKV